MAVLARFGNGPGSLDHLVHVLGLRCLERGRSCVPKSLGELPVVGPSYRGGEPVRTDASGLHDEVCGLVQRDGGVLDNLPSGINIRKRTERDIEWLFGV